MYIRLSFKYSRGLRCQGRFAGQIRESYEPAAPFCHSAAHPLPSPRSIFIHPRVFLRIPCMYNGFSASVADRLDFGFEEQLRGWKRNTSGARLCGTRDNLTLSPIWKRMIGYLCLLLADECRLYQPASWTKRRRKGGSHYLLGNSP